MFKEALLYYFITDSTNKSCKLIEQVKTVVKKGATTIGYCNNNFQISDFNELTVIQEFCKCNFIPLIVHDNILLAKAINADGVFVENNNEDPIIIKRTIGKDKKIGISISDINDFINLDIKCYDFIGAGPVLLEAQNQKGRKGININDFKTIIKKSKLPVIGFEDIDEKKAAICLSSGAQGIAVGKYITESRNIMDYAERIGKICSNNFNRALLKPWENEFKLIDLLLKYSPENVKSESYIRVHPGDDACFLNTIENPVISSDTQKEGIHFSFDWQSPLEIGYKAVVITLSDLAASYADPVSLFVNLSLPSYISEKTIERVYKGINQALMEYECTLGGGNISGGDNFSLDLFIIGTSKSGFYPEKSNARPGDFLYSSGPLGLARAGLESLEKNDMSFKELIYKFKKPKARFDAAKILEKNNIKCVMDISDGLSGDAKQLAKASHISIEICLDSKDFHPDLLRYCKKRNFEPEKIILSGGEDYELLFSCSSEIFNLIKKDLPQAFMVGKFLPFDGQYIINLPDGIHSYQHGNHN